MFQAESSAVAPLYPQRYVPKPQWMPKTTERVSNLMYTLFFFSNRDTPMIKVNL